MKTLCVIFLKIYDIFLEKLLTFFMKSNIMINITLSDVCSTIIK